MDNDRSDDWYDPETTTFGDRLTGARESAGLEVEELAKRLGVKPKTIRAWEDDRSEPRANRTTMLAGLLNVSLVWLMTGKGDGPRAAAKPAGGDLLAEIKLLRRDAVRLSERLGLLEARLAARLEDAA